MSTTATTTTANAAAAAAAAAAVLYDIDQTAFNAYMQSFYATTPAASSSPSSCNSPSIDPQTHALNMPPFYCSSPMLSSSPSYSQMYAGAAGVGPLTPPSSTDPAALLYNNGSPCNLQPSNPNAAAAAAAQNLFAYASQLHNPYYLSNGVRPGNGHHPHHDNKQEVKRRRRLSPEETKRLTAVFQQITTKPDATLRQQLADELGMTARAVQVWFQNRRAKVKREKDPNALDETDSNGCVSPSLSPSPCSASASSTSSSTISAIGAAAATASNVLISALSSNIGGESNNAESSTSSTPCSDLLGFSFEHLLPFKEDCKLEEEQDERMNEQKKEDLEFESMLILDDNLVDPPANLNKDFDLSNIDVDSMVKPQVLSLALEAAGYSLEDMAASFSEYAHATAASVQSDAMFGTSMDLVEQDAHLAKALEVLYQCDNSGNYQALGEHCPDFLGLAAQYPLTPRSNSSPTDYFTQPEFTAQKAVKGVRAIAPRLPPYPINYGPIRTKEVRKARSMSGSPYFKVESPLKQQVMGGGGNGYLWS